MSPRTHPSPLARFSLSRAVALVVAAATAGAALHAPAATAAPGGRSAGSAAGPAAPTRVQGWGGTADSVAPGSTFTVQVRLTARGAASRGRVVRLVGQGSGATWGTIATTTSNAQGRAVFSLTAPAAAGDVLLRLQVAAGRRTRAVTTPTLVVRVTPSRKPGKPQGPSTSSPTPKPPAPTPPVPVGATTPDRDAVLDLVNQARAQARACGDTPVPAVGPVARVVPLDAAAQQYAEEVLANGRFSHTGANGSTVASRVEAQGYRWSALGENLAAGQSSAQQTVDDWLASPGHCRNLMNGALTQIGIGHATGTQSLRSVWIAVLADPA